MPGARQSRGRGWGWLLGGDGGLGETLNIEHRTLNAECWSTSRRPLPFESPATSESGVARTCHRTPRRQARNGRPGTSNIERRTSNAECWATSRRQLAFESPATFESGVAPTCHRTPRRQARSGRSGTSNIERRTSNAECWATSRRPLPFESPATFEGGVARTCHRTPGRQARSGRSGTSNIERRTLNAECWATSRRQLAFESPATFESGVARTCHRTPRRQARSGRFMDSL